MLKLRLTRTGKKDQAHFRIVVAEHTAPIKGKFIDIVGHYDPRTKKLVIKKEEIIKWLDNGATPSNTVAKLLKKEGIKHNLIKIHTFKKRTPKKKEEESSDKKETPKQDTSKEKTEDSKPPVEEKDNTKPEETQNKQEK